MTTLSNASRVITISGDSAVSVTMDGLAKIATPQYVTKMSLTSKGLIAIMMVSALILSYLVSAQKALVANNVNKEYVQIAKMVSVWVQTTVTVFMGGKELIAHGL